MVEGGGGCSYKGRLNWEEREEEIDKVPLISN